MFPFLDEADVDLVCPGGSVVFVPPAADELLPVFMVVYPATCFPEALVAADRS